MTHREAIQKLEGLHEMIEETLATATFVPVKGDGETTDAEMATAVMRSVWRGYQQALEHAIEQLGRMEGLEQ